ncbi:WW domain-containing oxidoreductase [Colletotrichum orchidophilum]|uniref:WW domain-containing oxidoreductase n=1 Tax=Colletotrichum orchidophilum TaxID=1209926 RepID=A0A1G4BA09_9PEZI|nr:WW domain-containing oxidoreductase [Colletotrichum orchidophilum]OHE98122.1 WW domain-containing oxidoreductase [Colletotrichum orchidophilum]
MPSTYDAAATASGLVDELASQIKGKVVLTTGVSPGARNPEKAEKTAGVVKAAHPDVKTKVLELDLGSLAAVRKAAATVLSWDDVPFIDVLANNAGIMAVNYELPPDGYESQFATNHLAHFLFTDLIIYKVLVSNAPRIVNGSETYNKWIADGQSKTANMLFSLSVAEKLGKRGLLSFSLHPGVIGTNLSNHIEWGSDFAGLPAVDRSLGNKEGWAEFKWKTPDQGTATHVYAAFEPSLKFNNGVYL